MKFGLSDDSNRVEGHRQSHADRFEQHARSALLTSESDTAQYALAQAMEADVERMPRLIDEFTFLITNFPQRFAAAWQPVVEALWGYWAVFSARNGRLPLRQATAINVHSPTLEETQQPPTQPAAARPKDFGKRRKTDAPDPAPAAVGESLELAVLAVLRRVFTISDDAATVVLDRLRRQRPGVQFGHDVEFDCTVTGRQHVRCHVECKNYGRELRLGT